MRIGTNVAAMNTYSNLSAANSSKAGSLAKLSSGLRINKAGDDAAGLAISEKMKNQISGLTQATRNAQDGISLIQTAEGGLSETHSILNRMRDLTVQAANDTNSAEDRTAIQTEIDSLNEEIGRISKDTKFNGKALLSGATGDVNIQIGANETDAALTLDLGKGFGTASTDVATAALEVSAYMTVLAARSVLDLANQAGTVPADRV
jgi:flagellin